MKRPFLPQLEACIRAGIALTTMENIDDSPENRRQLYGLNKACSRDIPARGAFYTFEEVPGEANRAAIVQRVRCDYRQRRGKNGSVCRR